MIRLGKETLLQSRASWHQDPSLNKRNADLLAKDFCATRDKLLAQAIHSRFPATRGELEIRTEDNAIFWLVYKPQGDKLGHAVAVMTLPQTRIEGFHMVMEWHFKALDHQRN